MGTLHNILYYVFAYALCHINIIKSCDNIVRFVVDGNWNPYKETIKL